MPWPLTTVSRPAVCASQFSRRNRFAYSVASAGSKPSSQTAGRAPAQTSPSLSPTVLQLGQGRDQQGWIGQRGQSIGRRGAETGILSQPLQVALEEAALLGPPQGPHGNHLPERRQPQQPVEAVRFQVSGGRLVARRT